MSEPSPAGKGAASPSGGLTIELAERAGLTQRQHRCLDLHLRGASYRLIADAMDITLPTAYAHVQRALRKLAKVMT